MPATSPQASLDLSSSWLSQATPSLAATPGTPRQSKVVGIQSLGANTVTIKGPNLLTVQGPDHATVTAIARQLSTGQAKLGNVEGKQVLVIIAPEEQAAAPPDPPAPPREPTPPPREPTPPLPSEQQQHEQQSQQQQQKQLHQQQLLQHQQQQQLVIETLQAAEENLAAQIQQNEQLKVYKVNLEEKVATMETDAVSLAKRNHKAFKDKNKKLSRLYSQLTNMKATLASVNAKFTLSTATAVIQPEAPPPITRTVFNTPPPKIAPHTLKPTPSTANGSPTTVLLPRGPPPIT
jgi:hypothetical protein